MNDSYGLAPVPKPWTPKTNRLLRSTRAAAAIWATAIIISPSPLQLSKSTTPPNLSSARKALIFSLHSARPLEGRLTGLPYYPSKTKVEISLAALRGYQALSKTEISDKEGFREAARDIEEKCKNSRSPQDLADEAFLILLGPNTDELHEALLLLEEGARISPHSASIWSDLAAGYLAWTRPDPPGSVIALEMASRAVYIDPSLPEARFNFALALERCALFQQARIAWEQYLDIDPQSGWAAEARAHLTDLRKPTPDEDWNNVWKKRIDSGTAANIPYQLYPIASRDLLENILNQWADLSAKGLEEETKTRLETARRIGEILGLRNRILIDAVQAIYSAHSDVQIERLRQGHKNYKQGMQYFRQGDRERAKLFLQSAANLFSLAGSPCQYMANATLADIALQDGELGLSALLIDKIRATANLSRNHSLNKHLFLIEGLLYLKASDYTSAQEIFRPLEMRGGAIEDEELRGASSLYLAESTEASGQAPWLERIDALRQLSDFPTSPFLPQLFSDLADTLATNYPEAAAHFIIEAQERARKLGDKALHAEILIRKLKLTNIIGISASQDDLHELDQDLSNLPLSTRKILSLERDAALCNINRSGSKLGCLKVLTAAIDYHARNDKRSLPQDYILRAQLHAEAKNPELEEADLIKAIQAQEIFANLSPTHRHSLSEKEFEALIHLALRRNDPSQALSYYEWYRRVPVTNAHASNTRRGTPFPLGVTEINSRLYSDIEFTSGLPKQTNLVDFNISGKSVSAWIYQGRSARLVKLGNLPSSPLDTSLPDSEAPGLFVNISQLLKPCLEAKNDLVIFSPPSLRRVNFSRLATRGTGYRFPQESSLVIIGKNETFNSKGDLKAASTFARKILTHPPIKRPSRIEAYKPPKIANQQIPAHTTILEYKVFGEATVLWAVQKSGVNVFQLSIAPRQLGETIKTWNDTILQKNYEKEQTLAEGLYKTLIGPAQPLLTDTKNLVIVPDDLIAKMPLAALRNKSTGRFLIEEYALSYTPSTTFYLHQNNINTDRNHSSWTVLALSDPHSQEQNTNRTLLSGATAETNAIAHLYPGSDILVGRMANDYYIYHALNKHEIVHYSGHWNPWHPTYDGSINADRVPTSDSTRLVVLSACSSITERLGRNEYSLGTVQPLLDHGVPAVIASLWEINDAEASLLLVDFYKHLRDGSDGANALRAAELDLLKGSDPSLRDPLKWAGFQLFGFGGI